MNKPFQHRGQDAEQDAKAGRNICDAKKVAGKSGFINSGWRYKCGKTGNHAADMSPAIKAYSTMARGIHSRARPSETESKPQCRLMPRLIQLRVKSTLQRRLNI